MSKVYFEIDPELDKRMRHHCIDNDMTIKEFLNSSIENYFHFHEIENSKKQISKDKDNE